MPNNHTNFSRIFCLASLSFLLAACGLLPDYQSKPPDIVPPESWTGADRPFGNDIEPWLKDFESPKLTSLVDRAMRVNFDLHAAAARVDAALANAHINRADRLPQISGLLSASRSQRNITGGFSLVTPRTNDFRIGLDFSWELDIWGKLMNQHEAARMDYHASQADYAAARLSLAANVAKTWFTAIEAHLQVKLTKNTLDNFENNRAIIEEGFAIGINEALDVRLSRANVAAAQNSLEAQRLRRDAAVRSLEILLGHYPSASAALAERLPGVNQPVPGGLPSDLLNRRPDIIAAEKRLAATDQRLTAAKKNYLPSFALTANGGNSTTHLADLLDFSSLVWALAANITQPIFQGGRIMAQDALADANRRESLNVYAQAILQAFSEVETALRGEQLLSAQQAALRLAAKESVEGEVLAEEQYRAGLTDIITLLEAQRRAFDAQSALIQVDNQRLQNRVDLYLALGGPFADERKAPVESEHGASVRR